jgi:hypothetical protein
MKLRSWLHRSFHLDEQQRLKRESAESFVLQPAKDTGW